MDISRHKSTKRTEMENNEQQPKELQINGHTPTETEINQQKWS